MPMLLDSSVGGGSAPILLPAAGAIANADPPTAKLTPRTYADLEALAESCPIWQPTQSAAPVLPEEVTNATVEISEDEQGAETKKIVPLVMSEVLSRIRERTKNWPRRVDQSLFIDDHGVSWLEKSAALFGWLQSRVGKIDWHKVIGCVGREEVFAELRRTSQRYQAVEEMPHEPPIAGHYYACQAIESGDGDKLAELINRFQPAAPIDRDLIQAALMTVVWGGHGGARPCFVITSDDGRGAGKSKLAEMIGHVAGGIVSFSNNEPISEIKARLLSPEALTKRVALLDNLKTLKFSWSELEALITAPIISGKRMYVGEGQRPNTITWFCTLNGASLSTDMAQRAVIIKVKRPTRAGNWEEETLRFILDHRQAIIADLVGCLRTDAATLAQFSRWATWEKSVLARLPEPADAQAIIAERQGAVDVEADEAELIQDYFRQQLEALNYATDREEVLIPSATVARWLNWATNDNHKVIAAGRIIGQLCTEGRLPRLRQNRTNAWGKGLIWSGEHTDVEATVCLDLQERIAKQIESRK